MSNVLYSTVRNTSGRTKLFGFLPPHGVTLDNNEDYVVFGDIRNVVGSNQGVGGGVRRREQTALEAAIDAGDLTIIQTPVAVPQLTLVTANRVVTADDNGKIFIASGTGAVTFTLPAVPKANLEFTFYNAVDQNMIITCPTADIMIVFNDVAADSVALQTTSEKAGGQFRVIGTGTKWAVIPGLWETSAGAQTATVAT